VQRKSPEELAPLLARTRALAPLTQEEVRWLARRVPEMRAEKGLIVYGPTADSPVFFLLLEGRVRLYKVLGRREFTLEIIEAGQLFGEVPALAGRTRGTYAETLAPSRMVLIRLELFRRLARENPEVGLRLAELLAGRLYEHRERMADVALKKVPARLAGLLMRLLETEGVVTREGVGIRTRYTHEQFASMIGAERVAVSRAMAELRNAEAVKVAGRRIYLRDETVLSRAAEAG
jgi:CRP/FNR family transcriptional regulator, cyclic AMP receptor protein